MKRRAPRRDAKRAHHLGLFEDVHSNEDAQQAHQPASLFERRVFPMVEDLYASAARHIGERLACRQADPGPLVEDPQQGACCILLCLMEAGELRVDGHQHRVDRQPVADGVALRKIRVDKRRDDRRLFITQGGASFARGGETEPTPPRKGAQRDGCTPKRQPQL